MCSFWWDSWSLAVDSVVEEGSLAIFSVRPVGASSSLGWTGIMSRCVTSCVGCCLCRIVERRGIERHRFLKPPLPPHVIPLPTNAGHSLAPSQGANRSSQIVRRAKRSSQSALAQSPLKGSQMPSESDKPPVKLSLPLVRTFVHMGG